MKVGILTQPLHSNYGGLLQAWALQRILSDMGHDATIINRVWSGKSCPLWYQTLSFLKNEVYIVLGLRKRRIKITNKLRDIAEQHVIRFRQNRYRGISPEIRTDEELLDYINKSNFDAYVVGSDQVWRPCYSPDLKTYFLDFAKEDKSVKKIAYAASFGVDCWEYTPRQERMAAELAPLFDTITVRESSGVRLVKEHFKCRATHVLDPTMLLDKEDYLSLVENPTLTLHKSDGELFCYILDKTEETADVINKCSARTGFAPYYCNCKTPLSQVTGKEKIEECIVLPVEQWLKSFADAKMVVTDSFHGAVFSIIFNRPFWVIANKKRGEARFRSLLKQFGLEDRIVNNASAVNWTLQIDWNIVNDILNKSIEFSKSVLIKAFT